MKKIILVLLLSVFFRLGAMAEEGMWIPMLLEQLNIKRMQDLGLKLSTEDIYSINKSSLKDAIVQFGAGCTANIVSPEGLILTNHHCGLGAIQRQSSLQHDYLTDGFWAGSFAKELYCQGVTVTMLVRMEDVTAKVLVGVDPKLNQLQRSQMIKRNIEKLEKAAVQGTRYEARIRPFYYGNQYYMFVNEVFKDIRLVGAPPTSIGNFGGDSDNWMWPRHTGDFSVFRIYADKDNKAADYSADNVPYKPKTYLPVSLKGYQKGDFTFVIGYPGSTREYLTSYGVDLIANSENPMRISLRKKRLDIIQDAMLKSRLVRIQYASKANGIANAWKKMIGESIGIRRVNAVKEKEQFEQKFQAWADSGSARKAAYGNLLGLFESTYKEFKPVDLSSFYITEAGQGIEVVRFSSGFRELVKLSKNKETKPAEIEKLKSALARSSRDFFKNYQPAVDEVITAVMLQEMATGMEYKYLPAVFNKISRKYNGKFRAFAAEIFSASLFTDSTRLFRFIDKYQVSHLKKLENDPAYQLMASIYERNEKDIYPLAMTFTSRIDSLQRIYMSALMEMQQDRKFYPDANSTMRLAYGKVDDYQPADAVNYHYFTTLAGVMQKEDSTVFDYRVNPKLKQLFKNKDYGRYADKDGSMHVAFTASNHTTGGNSGSPVLNADGELIGLNFDRNWEGTLSDLYYDPLQCRNISLDIRYCLFVMEKVAGADRLISEMRIIYR
jgi:hypothetical protein